MGNSDPTSPPLNTNDIRFSPTPPEVYSPHMSGLHHGSRRRRPRKKKSLLYSYLLAIPPFGIFGGHHFYLGRPEFGMLYLFTAGLLGIGWFLDLFRLPLLVELLNKRRAEEGTSGVRRKKNVIDAYILWMPLGLFGFHHYYLGRWPWAVAYTFTLGLAGAGWLFDACRMHSLVDEANNRLRVQTQPPPGVDPEQLPGGEEHRSLVDSYVLGLSVFGLLGAHHYYMGRFFVGIVYTFSLGLVGIGWICDWFTMSVVFRRAQHVRKEGDDGLRYLDDAYRFLWPFGFLGLHHFYLRRPGYGFLYLFTLGLFFVGWIYDIFRLPSLLKETNRRVLEERAHLAEIQERLGPNTRVMGNQHYYVAYPTRDPATGGVTCPSSAEHVQNTLPALVSVPPTYSRLSSNHNSGSADTPPTYQQTVAGTSMATISEEEEEEGIKQAPSVPPRPAGMDNLGYGLAGRHNS